MMSKFSHFLKKQNYTYPPMTYGALPKAHVTLPNDFGLQPLKLWVSQSLSALRIRCFWYFITDSKLTNIRTKEVKGPWKVSTRGWKKPTLYILLRTIQLKIIATDIGGQAWLSWVWVWKDSNTAHSVDGAASYRLYWLGMGSFQGAEWCVCLLSFHVNCKKAHAGVEACSVALSVCFQHLLTFGWGSFTYLFCSHFRRLLKCF